MKTKALSAVALALSLSLTGCLSAPEQEDPASNATIQQEGTDSTHTDSAEMRVESGYAEDVRIIPSMTQDIDLTENNFLRLSDSLTFTVEGSGITEKTSQRKSAAEGEVLRIIEYRTESANPADEGFSPDVEVRVDGETVETLLDIVPNGFIIVSAPVDADISLAIPYEDSGVEQVIAVATGERLSQGFADAWYLPATGEVTDGDSVTQNVEKETAKLEASIISAHKTPFTYEDGWADGGKGAWLEVEASEPAFTITNHLSMYDVKCLITATDENGVTSDSDETYAPDHTHDSLFRFLVPADSSEFDISMTCEAGDVEDLGERVGQVDPMTVTTHVSMK